MNYFRFLLLTALLCFSSPIFAWTHGVSIGWGDSKELNQPYSTYGLFINTKLYRFKNLDPLLILTIDPSLGFWRTNTPKNNQLLTLAVSAAFRAYFFPANQHPVTPYLLATFGPTYLSKKHLGNQEQGAHFAFQSTLGAGAELFPHDNRAIDMNLRMIHYCNAGLAYPNKGFDIFYVFSVGYLF